MRRYFTLSILFKYLFILSLQTYTNLLPAQTVAPGVSIFDTTGYVEYLPGNLPVVISVPHGGYLQPLDIPRRDCSGCVYNRDLYTQELARSIIDDFFNTTGCYPHVIINLLHRNRFDANRSIETAADGDPTVEEAYHSYHAFIDMAKAQVEADYGRGLFLDLHGHAHTIQRVELGYRLSRSQLQQTDNQLNQATLIQESSIRALVGENLQDLTHAELLRGAKSLGTMLENRGFPTVPSRQDPFPMGSEDYFSGGYNTGRHSSENGGKIDGIQIECNQDIRFIEANRERFADSLTLSINEYLQLHYFEQYQTNYCGLATSTSAQSTAEEITLFPNPATNQINLSAPTMPLQLRIQNHLGQELRSISWKGDPIDVQELPNGFYLISIRRNKQLIDIKPLIKH